VKLLTGRRELRRIVKVVDSALDRTKLTTVALEVITRIRSFLLEIKARMSYVASISFSAIYTSHAVVDAIHGGRFLLIAFLKFGIHYLQQSFLVIMCILLNV